MTGAGFTLDLGKCVGCGACVLACRLENRLPGGVGWRRILTLNAGRHAAGPTFHMSLACHHCRRPACLAACPSGAWEKRPDGVVRLNAARCVGCRYCEMACPFGAPSYDRVAGVMTKCHLCADRIDRGLPPACVAACPTEALGYKKGDIETGPATRVPGFSDPAGCDPNISFRLPRGGIRSARLQKLREVLKNEDAKH